MFPFKVCCIQNLEEALLAINAGAAALGLVGPMPSGPGVLPDEQSAFIAAQVKAPTDSFLLTSETSGPRILQHYQKVKSSHLQLTDAVEEGTYLFLRSQLPLVKLVQVIHVTGSGSIEEARRVAPHVDALLLDSGNPNKAIKELGGTGRTHNWEISRSIVEAVDIPVWLAGGLHPGNVREAVEHVRPFGVDVCSGLRVDGLLVPEKLRLFAERLAEI